MTYKAAQHKAWLLSRKSDNPYTVYKLDRGDSYTYNAAPFSSDFFASDDFLAFEGEILETYERGEVCEAWV